MKKGTTGASLRAEAAKGAAAMQALGTAWPEAAEAIADYLVAGLYPDDEVAAILAGDLYGAASCEHLRAIAQAVAACCPKALYGSYDKLHRWVMVCCG